MMPGDPVVGSTVLRRPAIQAPNFVTAVSGWSINADGSAEFNNLTIRGTFQGTDYIINANGVFTYSPSEGAGNLIASSNVSSAGTDSFGNNYLAGESTYGAGFATSLQAGFVAFYTGSLAGGWTSVSQVAGDVAGNLQVNAAGTLELIGSGGVTIQGSSATQGPNGTGFFNTQGLASGSYGSTHQHTLPNFPTATHTHNL